MEKSHLSRPLSLGVRRCRLQHKPFPPEEIQQSMNQKNNKNQEHPPAKKGIDLIYRPPLPPTKSMLAVGHFFQRWVQQRLTTLISRGKGVRHQYLFLQGVFVSKSGSTLFTALLDGDARKHFAPTTRMTPITPTTRHCGWSHEPNSHCNSHCNGACTVTVESIRQKTTVTVTRPGIIVYCVMCSAW